jgi:hypothetical protein
MATVNRAERFRSVPQVGRFSAYEVTGPTTMVILFDGDA